jgi:hypothetical protein
MAESEKNDFLIDGFPRNKVGTGAAAASVEVSVLHALPLTETISEDKDMSGKIQF